MRKAKLIKEFIENDNQGDRTLCVFHKTIEIEDIPPIGYSLTFPEGKTITRFYVERADVQNKSGNVTLYSTMNILRYENWDYSHSVGIIKLMEEKGWEAKKLHKRILNVQEGKVHHEGE